LLGQQYAGGPVAPADTVAKIMIESSFNLDANKKITTPIKMDLASAATRATTL